MKKLLRLSTPFLLLGLMACQNELDESDWVFLGDWDSKNYALQIYQNGYGVCNSRKWLLPVTYEGRVKISSNRIVFTDQEDEIRIRFNINERPDKDSSGTTFMILDGERFTKR